MNLVEILARELSGWPEHGVSCIVQDPDLALYEKWGDGPAPLFKDGEWVHVWFAGLDPLLASILATDHETAIVTREMWWNEARRIDAHKSMADEVRRARAKIHKLNNSYASAEQCKEYPDQSVTWVGAQLERSRIMELVQILARELSEWPEGVASMSQDSDEQVSHYERTDQMWTIAYEGSWNSDGYLPVSRFTVSGLATDHATAIVTREMWEAERARVISNHTSKKGGSGSFKTTFPLGAIGDIPIADRYGDPRVSRDRIRAIDVQLADLTLERAERIAELAAEGFFFAASGGRWRACWGYGRLA
jgi:hypothetical protein